LIVKPSSERLERLLDSDASPFERGLLEAATAERPSAALTASMERALGLSGGAVAAPLGASTGAGTAAHAVAAKAGMAKLAAALFVGAGLVGVGFVAYRNALPDARELSGRAGAAVMPPVGTAEQRSPVGPVDPGSSAAESGALREEIEHVDAIRRAIQLEQYEHGSRLIQRHQARFPEGALGHEVRALKRRVELALQNRRSEPSDRATEDASRR